MAYLFYNIFAPVTSVILGKEGFFVKIFGIICEYNPFHNGHYRQLQEIGSENHKLCLMSGNYVQRGEPAMIDKWHRAEAAVRSGADLVLELPLTYALRSAEGFGSGGVEILNRLGCVDALSFGCESADREGLITVARMLLQPDLFVQLKNELAAGCSFPTARAKAVATMGGNAALLEKPNDILAVEYCKAILQQNSTIEPVPIHRDGCYHTGQGSAAPSASFLRGQEHWEGYMPDVALAVFSNAPRYGSEAGERAWLARLRGMTEQEFAALPFGSEGLWRKIMHCVRENAGIEDILTAAKSKRYTRTRLMRLLLCAYLGITEEIINAQAPYVRVLAMNERGQRILRMAKKQGTIPILNGGEQPVDAAYGELERRASDLYDLFRMDSVPAAGQEKRNRSFRLHD